MMQSYGLCCNDWIQCSRLVLKISAMHIADLVDSIIQTSMWIQRLKKKLKFFLIAQRKLMKVYYNIFNTYLYQKNIDLEFISYN